MFTKQDRVLFFCIPFLFVAIYFQVFFADFAFTDEAYQLWHNNDNTNFIMFHSQGRWLSGLLFQKLFSSISTIEQLKFLRLFSLAGWIVTALVLSILLKKWIELLAFDKHLWLAGTLYFVCSISVCIYVGWASCLEVFLATLSGSLSGHLLFKNLYKQQREIHLPGLILLGSALSGVVCLFIYQTAFGIFLIPFLLYYIKRKQLKPGRIIVIGIIFYLIIYLIYYFLFKYSLQAYHLEASNRTDIKINILKKLSFFFSGPFPQGFSMNLLFKASSIFSQIFYPLVLLVWVIITFKRNKHNTFVANVLFIGFIFLLLGLIYLPLMIAAENFPSYRTLFSFNFAVFLMVIDSLLYVFKENKKRRLFMQIVIAWLILTAIYTFNFQYINPLKKEYRVLRQFIQTNYSPAIKQVYFIRADKLLFTPQFHTRIYRDELGAPSTNRDWVPEPIVKQIIFELTKNRRTAQEIIVAQFENSELFNQANINLTSNSLLIDMNRIFNQQ